MGIVAEYTIQSPILHRALNGVPEMKLRNPAVYPEPDGSAKAFLWAWGDDFLRSRKPPGPLDGRRP